MKMDLSRLPSRVAALGAIAAVAVAVAAPAHAAKHAPAKPAQIGAPLQIGVSDQSPQLFSDPRFSDLGIRYARLMVPWNVALTKGATLDQVRTWLNDASAAGVEPHIAFNTPAYTRANRLRLPSVAAYKRAISAFRRDFPQVRVYTPWNEANHFFQPTARNPQRAAQFYKVLRSSCPKCKVLGADLLDSPNLRSWLRGYFKAIKIKPRLWGLHNYQDSNHRRPAAKSLTVQLLSLVPGQIWATETGGVVRFQTDKGRVAYKYSPSRAGKSMQYMFSLLHNPLTKGRYRRVYVYNWFGSTTATRAPNRWDSGLIGLDGRARPAFGVFSQEVLLSQLQAKRRAAAAAAAAKKH